MVTSNTLTCPDCNGKLRHLGYVRRILRTKGGNVDWIKIRRLVCDKCKTTHRELPDYILPYKHYDSKIIKGVLDGTITPCDLDYEDYPNEITMRRWQKLYSVSPDALCSTLFSQITISNLE